MFRVLRTTGHLNSIIPRTDLIYFENTERTTHSLESDEGSSLYDEGYEEGDDHSHHSDCSHFFGGGDDDSYSSDGSLSENQRDEKETTQRRFRQPRCLFRGCRKIALGALGLCGGRRCNKILEDGEKCPSLAIKSTRFCIRHGGGHRCKKKIDGKACGRSAVSGWDFCCRHGGGHRCKKKVDGKACDKSALSRWDFCCRHGGGRRCKFAADGKAYATRAVGSSGFCKRHGGGHRCKKIVSEGKACGKSAQNGSDFCGRHGGGHRCSKILVDGKKCPNLAVDSRLCKRHGGGPRCKKMVDGKLCAKRVLRVDLIFACVTGFCEQTMDKLKDPSRGNNAAKHALFVAGPGTACRGAGGNVALKNSSFLAKQIFCRQCVDAS
jgi:hypothetical protein